MPVQVSEVTHNNKGHFYRIAIDIAKEGAEVWDLTPYFKGRVGDDNFGLQIVWYYQGRLLDVTGKTPYIKGNVGHYSFDEKKNLQIAPDADVVTSHGKPSDCQANGQATYYFPQQMFPTDGIFKGFIGLEDENQNLTGVDIWFRVMPGVARMGHACDVYVDILDKTIADFKEKIRQQSIDFDAALQQELQKEKDLIQQKLDAASDAMDEDTAALKKLAASVGAIQAQIDAGNVITRAEFNELDNRISRKLSTMRLNPEAFPNEAALRAKYPQGNDQLNVTTDNGHLWIWMDGDFKDCGQYQTAGLSQDVINKIEEALAFANSGNLIKNGNFTAEDYAPAAPNTDDTQLAKISWLDQSWLQVTAIGHSDWRGVRFPVNDYSKIKEMAFYPLLYRMRIRSTVDQELGIAIHFYDADGKDMGNTLTVDVIHLTANQLLNYKQSFTVTDRVTGAAKIAVLVYSTNPNSDMGTIIINSVSLEYLYRKNLDSENLFNSNIYPTSDDTVLSSSLYLNQSWTKITATGKGDYRGIGFEISDRQKLQMAQYYPVKLVFNAYTSLAHKLSLAVHYFDANGKDMGNSDELDSLDTIAGGLIHYDNQFRLNNVKIAIAKAAKVSVMLYAQGNGDLGTILINDESASLVYRLNPHGSNLFNGTTYATTADSEVSSAIYLDDSWIQLTSTGYSPFRGVGFEISDRQKLQMAQYYPIRLNFNFYTSLAQKLSLAVHYFDANGKDMNNSDTIGNISLYAGELYHYVDSVKLNADKLAKAAKASVMIYTPGKDELGRVLIKNATAQLVYKTNTQAHADINYPTVYLSGSTSGMSKDKAVTMQFKFLNPKGLEINGYASTKWQGDSSLAFDKKAYRIKTFADQDLATKLKIKPCPLWEPDNKFNLKAYYTDSLLCRDVVNANIGTDIWATQKGMPDDLVNTDDFGFVDGFPVRLVINDQFAGVYSFNTAKGDYGENAKAVISGETYSDTTAFRQLPEGGVKLDGSDFEMISPDEPTDEIKQATNDLITFVSTSSDDDFKAQLSKHIDLESLIDYFIFLNVIENTDAAGKNQTLITWDLKKWYFHAYDLDTTFGVDSNGNVSAPSIGLLGLNSNLFNRLNTLFVDEIKARYKELRTWLTPVYVLKMYRDNINQIGEGNYEDEFQLWNNPNHDKDNYNLLKTHIYKRFQLLDSLWLK